MSLYAWGRNTYGQLGVRQEPRPIKSSKKRQGLQRQQHPQHQQEEEEDEQQQQQQRAPAFEVKQLPRLGSGSVGQAQKPVCVEVDGECFVAAAAGEHHTLVVNQYGDVCTFGRGKEGQLGHGEASRLDTVDAPRKVEALSTVTVIAVGCGAFHSLAVTSSGRLYEWGLVHTEPEWSKDEEVTDAELLALAGPSQGNVDPALRLSSVVADSARRWLAATDDTDSESTSSAEDNGNSNANRMDDETIIMQQRMMGRLPTRNREAVPRLATSLRDMKVISISAGYAHSVAVTDQGRAFSSGQNDRGQLGLAHRIHSGIFREVVGMRGRFFLEVACGEQHNLARVLPSPSTHENKKQSSISSVNSLDQQAELFVWGGGRLGQLGLGAASTKLAPTHNPLLRDVGGGGVVSVSAGANHSVCALASGLVMSWGHAEYNQQGVAVVAGADLVDLVGDDSDRHGYFRVPRAVRGLMGTHVVSVHCGSNFTLAVDRDGVTHSFGWNEGDALGRGREGAYDPSPGRVPSLPAGVVSVAAGSRHGVAVGAEGPAVGRHLRPLVGDADSADVELLTPDAALRGEPGTPAHMSVISARCPYLLGHIEAARKHACSSAATPSAVAEEAHEGSDSGALSRDNTSGRSSRSSSGISARDKNGASEAAVVLCLEHATADTVALLARYLYTDEIASPDGSSDGGVIVSGEALDALAGLAQELLLPRLEALCVMKLPYSLRRRHVLRNPGTALATSGAVDVPRSSFVSDISALAGRPDHSDVLLVLPQWNWEFHCHKAVLCCSPWWYALLKGGFREGGGDTIDMSGLVGEGVTRPEAIEAAIRHVYTKSHLSVAGMDPGLVMEVVVIAEFMVLPTLTSACQSELARFVVDEESALPLGRFANRYRLPKLESLCQELLSSSSTVQ